MNIVIALKSLIYISLICTLLTLLFCKNKFIGSIKYICGISVLVSVIGVIYPFISSFGELIGSPFEPEGDSSSDKATDDLIINQSASYICDYVKILISQRYSLPKENISASVTLDTEDMENVIIKNITLSFVNTDKSLFPEIARYVSDTMGCECTVISK